jgi:hypothetical protein
MMLHPLCSIYCTFSSSLYFSIPKKILSIFHSKILSEKCPKKRPTISCINTMNFSIEFHSKNLSEILNKFWFNFDSILFKIWLKKISEIWIKFTHFLNRIWTKFVSKSYQVWMTFNQNTFKYSHMKSLSQIRVYFE